jgi:hypothetical protein
MPVTLRSWKAVLLLSLGFGVLWVVFGGLIHGFGTSVIVFNAAVGALLGAIGGPEFEAEGFVYPRLWQVCVAALGCLLFAISVEASPLGALFAAFVGAFLGYTARHWLMYASP